MKSIHAVFEYPARTPITSYCFRTIPLALLKEILARMERDSEATVRLKAEGTLAAVGAFVGPTRRRIAQQPGKAFSASAFSAPELLLPGRLSGVSIHHRLALGGHG